MSETATDPEDIPGHDDIHRIESAYLAAGGEFVVGVLDTSECDTGGTHPAGDTDVCPDLQRLETFDGRIVAMGGFLPNETGHEDERTVAGAVELHRMRVAPPYQGQGYGHQLLRDLERRAVEAGWTALLATTAKRQTRALDFYPAAGYERVDESTFGAYELVHFEKRLD